jgi:hypothetical protein
VEPIATSMEWGSGTQSILIDSLSHGHVTYVLSCSINRGVSTKSWKHDPPILDGPPHRSFDDWMMRASFTSNGSAHDALEAAKAYPTCPSKLCSLTQLKGAHPRAPDCPVNRLSP